jgi:hypothetical protein
MSELVATGALATVCTYRKLFHDSITGRLQKLRHATFTAPHPPDRILIGRRRQSPYVHVHASCGHSTACPCRTIARTSHPATSRSWMSAFSIGRLCVGVQAWWRTRHETQFAPLMRATHGEVNEAGAAAAVASTPKRSSGWRTPAGPRGAREQRTGSSSQRCQATLSCPCTWSSQSRTRRRR